MIEEKISYRDDAHSKHAFKKTYLVWEQSWTLRESFLRTPIYVQIYIGDYIRDTFCFQLILFLFYHNYFSWFLPHNIETRIHGRNIDTQRLRYPKQRPTISRECQEKKASWYRDIYSGHPPPPNFCPNWKTGKNLKEDLKKKGKGGEKEKKKRVIKHRLKYLNEA